MFENTSHDHHVDQGSGNNSSGPKLINLVISLVVELNHQRANLTAALHYSPDSSKQEFAQFYGVFLEAYKLTDSLISPELKKQIVDWVEVASIERTGTGAKDRKMGLDLSGKLIDELTNLGLLQLFEEHVAPPFLFDFDLRMAKAIIANADKRAAELQEDPEPGPTVPEEEDKDRLAEVERRKERRRERRASR